MAGRRKATQDEWVAHCTCPGADVTRRFLARAEARRAERTGVFADVDLSGHPDAETIERRLRAALQTHGEPVPPGLTGMSRAAAAVTGPRGTRSVRLLGLAARAVAAGARWAWQPGAAANSKDRHALRQMYVSLAALAGIAALLTAAAVRSSGWRRLPWAVSALLAWLFTTRSIALGTVASTMLRTVDSAGGADESGCTPGSVGRRRPPTRGPGPGR